RSRSPADLNPESEQCVGIWRSPRNNYTNAPRTIEYPLFRPQALPRDAGHRRTENWLLCLSWNFSCRLPDNQRCRLEHAVQVAEQLLLETAGIELLGLPPAGNGRKIACVGFEEPHGLEQACGILLLEPYSRGLAAPAQRQDRLCGTAAPEGKDGHAASLRLDRHDAEI